MLGKEVLMKDTSPAAKHAERCAKERAERKRIEAVAPELLGALIGMLEVFCDHPEMEELECVKRARDVVSSIRGPME